MKGLSLCQSAAQGHSRQLRRCSAWGKTLGLGLLSVACSRQSLPTTHGENFGGQGSVELDTPSPVSGLPRRQTSKFEQPRARGEAHFEVLPWAGFPAAATLSIDDTQPSLFEHFEELVDLGFAMTLYVTPGNDSGDSFAATLKRARDLGFELGNHSYHHCRADLSQCGGAQGPLASLAEELDQTNSYLEKLGQSSVTSIAYPYGDLAYVEASRQRFLFGRTVQAGRVRSDSILDPMKLPVFAVSEGQTRQAFSVELRRAEAESSWTIFLFHTLLPSAANWYAGVQMAEVSAAFGAAKGRVWLDSVERVGAYWLGAQLVAAAPEEAGRTDSGSMTWTRHFSLPAHFPRGQYLRVKVSGGKLLQEGEALSWDSHGYYELALDLGELSWQAEG